MKIAKLAFWGQNSRRIKGRKSAFGVVGGIPSHTPPPLGETLYGLGLINIITFCHFLKYKRLLCKNLNKLFFLIFLDAIAIFFLLIDFSYSSYYFNAEMFIMSVVVLSDKNSFTKTFK